MKIRMIVDIPLTSLKTVVSCLEKNKCQMKGTNFIQDGEVKKRKKFLPQDERKQVAAWPEKERKIRGMSVRVAEQFDVTPGVIRSIWAGKS